MCSHRQHNLYFLCHVLTCKPLKLFREEWVRVMFNVAKSHFSGSEEPHVAPEPKVADPWVVMTTWPSGGQKDNKHCYFLFLIVLFWFVTHVTWVVPLTQNLITAAIYSLGAATLLPASCCCSLWQSSGSVCCLLNNLCNFYNKIVPKHSIINSSFRFYCPPTKQPPSIDGEHLIMVGNQPFSFGPKSHGFTKKDSTGTVVHFWAFLKYFLLHHWTLKPIWHFRAWI